MFFNVLSVIIALGDPGSVDTHSAPTSNSASISRGTAGAERSPLPWVFTDEPLATIAAPDLGRLAALDLALDVPVSRRARAKRANRQFQASPADLRKALADARLSVRSQPAEQPRTTVILNLDRDIDPGRSGPGPAPDRAKGFVRLGTSDAGDILWREADGLFYVSARINGAVIRLIVDTGASFTVLSAEDARRVGVDPGQITFAESADTAAGRSPMARIVLANLEIGQNVAAGVPAMVASGPLRTSLLGQNVLTRLSSVTIEGDRMTLR